MIEYIIFLATYLITFIVIMGVFTILPLCGVYLTWKMMWVVSFGIGVLMAHLVRYLKKNEII